MESENDKTNEVTTSSNDVYATPIALGFEALDATSPSTSPSLVYGPSNFTEIEPSTCLVTYNKDIRDGAGIRGRCGLYNLGNTCFMNSGLQCLMSTMPLVKFLLGYYQNRKTFDDTLFGQFQKLFAKIWSGQYSIVHPKEFKQTLGIYHTQFQDYRQHDCQEFLALLLDSLHEQLNFKSQSTNRNTEAGPSSEKQPITFEHNINNKASSNLTLAEEESKVNDKSKNAVTSHSSLTFDNMKESKSEKFVGVDLKNEYYEKRKSGSNIAGFTVNPISDDSNHSTISEQSSESEQCSVMKNLKLRSSPTVSQSNVGLSPRVVNELGDKVCDVTSSDDININKHEINEECESSGSEVFKRVHSLQDFRSKNDDCSSGLIKASSDIDLVCKASGDTDETEEFDTGLQMHDRASQICDKSDISASLKSGFCDIEQKGVGKISGSHSESIILNNAIPTTSVPSLEDLYAKETKTLNTNVLATEYMEESITTDSDKFSKHDNTCERLENVDEEDLINNVMEVTTKSDEFEMPKKVKDVNIRADKKSKSPKGACGSSSGMGSEKEDCFSLSGVKRMKFEGTEKNLQMQEICKIQKEVLISEALSAQKPKNVEQIERVSCLREASPSVDSDVECDILEDQDEDNDMEVSDDNEGGEVMPQIPRTLAEGACYTTAEVLAAEDAWQKYLRRNDSIVVDTFQGQFKSTVVCAQCDQVSVTFEPFMYLSVPIPHAMERQLCITVIQLNGEATHVLLEMNKQDKILKVKQELCNLIGGNSSDIIIAEVLNWHISRILEDNTMLRYINDTSRTIFAFEMDQSTAGCCLDTENHSSAMNVTPATSQDNIASQADSFNDVDSYFINSNVNLGSETFSEVEPYYNQSSSGDMKNSGSLDAMVGTGLWEWNQNGSEKRRGSLETETGDNPVVDSTTSASGFDIGEDIARADSREAVEKSMVTSSNVTTDDWKSCAICLEEMPENELMVHTTCGGTFCSACLEMSAQHYRDSVYCCPVCSTPADMTEDFVPLTNAANHKPKTRIVAIPISYRCEKDISGTDNPHLFAHPSLLNLPSNLTGQHIYTCIQNIRPDLNNFKILLTDGTGLHCSRCLYMEHCSGCEIPQDGEAILRPGDHLAVSVQSVTEDQVREYQRVNQHKSMEKQRSHEPVTLLDCFSAFTQSEELDEQNPWFCPHCKENQRAKKTMTVWQYPDTLIIHLKRFVFHELSSTKVDNKVVFPIDNLDLNHFISGPKTKNLMYNLYSLVCHFGGANSGHYTAYAKHPVDGQWYYYNDETVSDTQPGDDEFTSTYVLFYQRKGTDKALQIPDDLDLGFEADVTDPEAQSSIPSVIFQPPHEDITLNLNNKTAAPSTSCESATSTSCHQVAASAGACDLFDSADQSDTCKADSSSVRAELAEADSTGPSFEFYS